MTEEKLRENVESEIDNAIAIGKLLGTEEDLIRAVKFGATKHLGQLDDEGYIYFISHCMPVAFVLRYLGCDIDVITAGLLHDTLEDTKTQPMELEISFNKRVARLVQMVSHDGQKDEVGFYFPRLHIDSDLKPTLEELRDATLIKFADRMSNITRMDSWDDKRKLQYLKRSTFWRINNEL